MLASYNSEHLSRALEHKKKDMAQAQMSKFIKDYELLQHVLQDSKKLKEGVLNFYNKVGLHSLYFMLHYVG